MARTKKSDTAIESTDEFLDGYRARQAGKSEECPFPEEKPDRRKAWLMGYKRREAEEHESATKRPAEWQEGYDAQKRGEGAATDPYSAGSPKSGFWKAGWQHAADEGRESVPPAVPPTLSDKDRVAGLNARGIDITLDKWRLLPDASQRTASRWLDDQLAGKDAPLPVCLLEHSPRHRAAVENEASSAYPLEIAVEFGSFSYPGDSMRIALKIPKHVADHAGMEKNFCGKRLKCILAPQERQTQLPGMEDGPSEVPGLFESKSWSSKPRFYSVTLNSKDGRHTAEGLMALAGKTGSIRILEVGTLADKSEDKPANNPPPPKHTGKRRSDNTADAAPKPKKQKKLADLEPVAPAAVERPDVIPFPAAEKLFLCQQQCLASLALAGVGNAVTADQVSAWNDEQRDEVDVWAKAVAAAVADGKAEVPETPQVLRGLIPDSQFADPVGHLQVEGVFVPRLSWFCQSCEQSAEATGDETAVCSACGHAEVVLVGFYGEPRCNRDGEFYVLHNEQFEVPIRRELNFRVLLSVVRGESGERRFRCGVLAEHKPAGTEEWVTERTEPHIRDNGRTTMADAIEAAIGRQIAAWSRLDGPEAAQAVADLKEYLGNISRGVHPATLEPEDLEDVTPPEEVQ